MSDKIKIKMNNFDKKVYMSGLKDLNVLNYIFYEKNYDCYCVVFFKIEGLVFSKLIEKFHIVDVDYLKISLSDFIERTRSEIEKRSLKINSLLNGDNPKSIEEIDKVATILTKLLIRDNKNFYTTKLIKMVDNHRSTESIKNNCIKMLNSGKSPFKILNLYHKIFGFSSSDIQEVIRKHNSFVISDRFNI